MVQIGRYTHVPVLHTVSLIDWATGGPLPAALRGARLREPRPKQIAPEISTNTSPAPPASDAGFW
jgi:glycolate oxidase iron-sulfur subunit